MCGSVRRSLGRTRRNAIAFVLLFAAAGAGAQVAGTNAVPGQTPSYTLNVESQLVVEAVTVKDKQGNFVHGLTARDFAVTEDRAWTSAARRKTGRIDASRIFAPRHRIPPPFRIRITSARLRTFPL